MATKQFIQVMPMFVQAPNAQQQPTLMFYAAQQQAAPPPVWTANEPPLGCSAPGKKKDKFKCAGVSSRL